MSCSGFLWVRNSGRAHLCPMRTGMTHMAGDGWDHIFEAVSLTVSWGSQFFSTASAGAEGSKMVSSLPCLIPGLQWLAHWAGWLLFSLCGIFLLWLALPHSMEVPRLSGPYGFGFSQRRAMVEAARPLWPCLGSSRTLLLLNSIVQASPGQLNTRGQDTHPTFLMGGEAQDLWSSLIYHKRLTGRLS